MKIKKIFSFFYKNLVLVALTSTTLCILLYASYYRFNLDYKPYNGVFQTFNLVRRILLGELPGRDFNPYIGLGPTYLSTSLTYLLGGNFAALQFSIHLITLTLHAIALLLLYFLSGFSLKQSIIASSVMVIILSFITKQFSLINEVAGPGTSNLNLRSALPFLTSLILLYFFRFFANRLTILCLLVGCLIGVQPLWSNDYGLPSTLSLIIIFIIYLTKQKAKNILFKILVIFISALTTFELVGNILTGANLTHWLESNFSGVANDQFWYFLWFKYNNKIFDLNQLFFNPLFCFYFLIFVTAVFIIAFDIFYSKSYLKHLILLYISITVFMAGILSSVGGTVSFRYYLLGIITSFFIVPLSISLLLTKKNYTFLKIEYVTPSFFLFLLIFYSVAPLIHMTNYSIFLFLNQQNFFRVEELGGWLPNIWKDSIQTARKIKEELKTELPKQKMLSTYSSGMDVIIGAINPTNIDYIIHALGDKARKQYLSNFKTFQPQYITTLREDYSSWETWNRRVNWWFYREILKNYQLVNSTFYNLIWQRLKQPIPLNSKVAMCQITQLTNNQVILAIKTEKSFQNNSQVYYIDLELNYHLVIQPTLVPLIGKRGLVNIIEKETASKYSIGKVGNHRYGMPPSHHSWHIPVEHQIGTISTIELKGYPEKRAKLIVKSCQAQLLAPIERFVLIRRIIPANVSNANWKNGISLNNLQRDNTQVMMSDSNLLTQLYPGMNITFLKSGKRQIIEINDNQIKVTGTPLDPIADGYPYPLTIKLR